VDDSRHETLGCVERVVGVVNDSEPTLQRVDRRYALADVFA